MSELRFEQSELPCQEKDSLERGNNLCRVIEVRNSMTFSRICSDVFRI